MSTNQKRQSWRREGLFTISAPPLCPLPIECLSGIERHCGNTLPDKEIRWPRSKFKNVQLFIKSNEQQNIKSPKHMKASMNQS